MSRFNRDSGKKLCCLRDNTRKVVDKDVKIRKEEKTNKTCQLFRH